MEAFVLYLYVGIFPIMMETFVNLSACSSTGQHLLELNEGKVPPKLRTVCVDHNGEVKWDSELQ